MTPPPEPQEVQLNLVATHHYSATVAYRVDPLPSNGRVLTLITPDGHAHEFPLDKGPSEAIGRGLIAPSVHVASAEQIPGATT